MNKVAAVAAEAVRDLADGSSLMTSAFGVCGIDARREGLLLREMAF